MNPLATSTDLHRLMAAPPPGNTTSFTALLGLPPPKAMELLHSPEPDKFPVTLAGKSYFDDVQSSHPFDNALIERAVFACSSSPEGSSVSAGSKRKVKAEQPAEIESENDARTAKRKEREKKGKGSSKKSRSKNESSVDGQELPYVHVRARRGQATDSHSLAERARREKINARMKLLQEIVPGCNKISGTALVLDEIINHVQSLQHQVEFLSMRLAAVTPSVDLNLDRIFAAESGSFMGSNITRMVIPPLEGQNSGRQQYLQQWHTDSLNPPVWGREEVNHSFVAQESSLLSFNASANSGRLAKSCK